MTIRCEKQFLVGRDAGMGITDREFALKAIDIEFQREVLDKLVRLETKMDTLVGNGQPGRMKLAEDKVSVLERNDLRNSVHNRLVNGAISTVISVAIALHKYWLK
ncbi:MAG: hypothetical protein ABSH02_03040 [Candidatus Sulfotelmatobacter sp.]